MLERLDWLEHRTFFEPSQKRSRYFSVRFDFQIIQLCRSTSAAQSHTICENGPGRIITIQKKSGVQSEGRSRCLVNSSPTNPRAFKRIQASLQGFGISIRVSIAQLLPTLLLSCIHLPFCPLRFLTSNLLSFVARTQSLGTRAFSHRV